MRELATAATETGATLYEVAPRDRLIRSTLTRANIETLLEPTTYIGLAQTQVDAVVAEIMTARQNDPAR